MGATAAVASVAGGTAFSSYAKIRAGQKQKEMFERNAQFADWQADDALARGETNEKRQRQQTEQTIGSQRTAFAAGGVDVNRGTAVDVQADAAYLGELDALTIRNNAVKEAYGYRVQADDLRQRGKYAKQEGYMGAAESIIGGGSSLLLAKYGGGPYTLYSPGYATTGPSTTRTPTGKVQ